MKLQRVGKLNNTAQLSREPPDKPIVLSERAKIELVLMEQFWNDTISDAEWLRLCDEKAGRIGKDNLLLTTTKNRHAVTRRHNQRNTEKYTMMESFVDKFISTAQRVDIQRERCAAVVRRLQNLILSGATSREISEAHEAWESHIINLTVAEIARGVAARNLERAGVLGRTLAERMAS